MNPKRSTLRYSLFKSIKIKDKKRILKTVKEKKKSHYIQGKLHRDLGRYFIRNFTGQKTWHDVFKAMKGKSYEKNPLPSQVIIQN